MKSWLLSLLVVASSPVLAAGTPDPTLAVEAALHEICAAFRSGDFGALELLLAPDFTLVASDAVQTTRAQEIASLRDGHAVYSEFRNHGMVTRLYGDDVAIVNGITSVAGTWDGAAFARELRFTDTLLRREGRWVLLASHATPIPAK